MVFQVLRFSKPSSVTTLMKLLRKTFFFFQTNTTGGKAFTYNNNFMKTRGLRCTYVRSGDAEENVRIVAVT